jgi:hypothetical protein
VLAGSGQTWGVPAQTFLTSRLGFRLETDGVAGFDATVTLRNLRSTDLAVTGDPGATTVTPGGTLKIRDGAASPLNGVGDHELKFLGQDPTASTAEALVDCYVPAAGTGASRSFYTP